MSNWQSPFRGSLRVPDRLAWVVIVLTTGFVSGFGAPGAPAPSSLQPQPVVVSPRPTASSFHVAAPLPPVASAPLPASQTLEITTALGTGPSSAVVAEFAPIAIERLPLHRPDPALSVVTEGELEPGETLSASLRRHGIPASVTHVLASEMRSEFDFRRSQPGDRYRLMQDPDGAVVAFRYRVGPEESFLLRRSGDGYVVSREQAKLSPRVARVAGVIETSLYNAIRALGEDPQLANDFADIFAWDIDFSRGVQPGDDFSVLYERLYRTEDDGSESYVRPGRILAARYRGASGGSHTAVYFEPDEGRGSYFRPDGSSVERAFLVAPLKFSRITSRYSAARRHPILKVTRPHHGIDYAAETGTPLWSVADGTVIYRGWAGGFGNLVKVRHRNGYVSYYAHLSRFASGLKVGQRVEQKQVLGFVGKTGLATGPHVCFRVAKDGQFVDPHRVKSPAGRPVPDPAWATFKIVRDSLLDDLDARSMAATQEAL